MKSERWRHFDGELLEIFLGEIDEFNRFREKIDKLMEKTSVKDIFDSFFSEFEDILD